MTEAGEKWVEANRRPVTTGIHVQVEQADHWIRAFYDEVERRAAASRTGNLCEAHGILCFERDGRFFIELKRELLGWDDGK